VIWHPKLRDFGGKMARRVRSRRFWERVVAAAEAGERTHAAVAAQFGIGQAALGYWLAKLRRERAEGRRRISARLLPVRIAGTRDPREHREVKAMIEIAVSGAAVRFPEGTEPRYIAALLVAMRSVPC
jgi:transposase-like protein